MTKPVIGMNADFRSAKGETPAYSCVTAGYYDAILNVGGIPVILPPYETEGDIEQILDRVDGVLLVGGADLDPRRDGWMLHPTVRLQDPRRETFDRTLMPRLPRDGCRCSALGQACSCSTSRKVAT